jgi:hypothetical protein
VPLLLVITTLVPIGILITLLPDTVPALALMVCPLWKKLTLYVVPLHVKSPIVKAGFSQVHAGAGTTTTSLAQPANVTVIVNACPAGTPLITPLFTVP